MPEPKWLADLRAVVESEPDDVYVRNGDVRKLLATYDEMAYHIDAADAIPNDDGKDLSASSLYEDGVCHGRNECRRLFRQMLGLKSDTTKRAMQTFDAFVAALRKNPMPDERTTPERNEPALRCARCNAPTLDYFCWMCRDDDTDMHAGKYDDA